jgi:hypothetical protein
LFLKTCTEFHENPTASFAAGNVTLSAQKAFFALLGKDVATMVSYLRQCQGIQEQGAQPHRQEDLLGLATLQQTPKDKTVCAHN